MTPGCTREAIIITAHGVAQAGPSQGRGVAAANSFQNNGRPMSASVGHTIHMRGTSIAFTAPHPWPSALSLSLLLFMVALTTSPTPTQSAPVTIASHARVAGSGALRSVPANSVTLRQGGDYQVRHCSRRVHLRARCWSNGVGAAISCK